MNIKLFSRAAASISALFAVSACATTGVPQLTGPSFSGFGKTVSISAIVVKDATQVQGWCFTPPDRRDFTGITAEVVYLAEMRNYNNNLQNYDVCRLKTPAKQLVAAAELSKFSLIEIANALTEIAQAEQLKSESINQLAERLKVTPAVDLDYKEESDKLSAEIAKLQAEKATRGESVALTPEAYTQIAVAQGKLESAASYLGQMLGTTIKVYRTISQMSDNQKQMVYNDAAGIYGGTVQQDAFAGFVGNLSQIAEGTISGAGGLAQAAYKLGEVEKPENVEDVEVAVDSAVEVTNTEAKQIVQNIDNGSLI